MWNAFLLKNVRLYIYIKCSPIRDDSAKCSQHLVKGGVNKERRG